MSAIPGCGDNAAPSSPVSRSTPSMRRSSASDSRPTVSIVANTLGAAPVIIGGSDDQKATWLPPLLEEPILCSFGLTEPDAGSDVARIRTTAVRRGDEYVLNGSKTFITNAGQAAWTVVFAKTDAAKGHRGLSAFVVPMDTPGVTVEKHLDKMGQRATDTSAFCLEDVGGQRAPSC